MEFPTSPSLTAQEKFPKCCVDYTAQHFSRWTFPEGSSALTKCHSLICQNLKLLCRIKYKHSENLNNNRNWVVHIFQMFTFTLWSAIDLIFFLFRVHFMPSLVRNIFPPIATNPIIFTQLWIYDSGKMFSSQPFLVRFCVELDQV